MPDAVPLAGDGEAAGDGDADGALDGAAVAAPHIGSSVVTLAARTGAASAAAAIGTSSPFARRHFAKCVSP